MRLNEINQLSIKIEIVKDEILRLETIVTQTTKSIQADIVQTSRQGDKQENYVIKLIEMKDKYKEMLVEYNLKRNELINNIFNLDNQVYIQILYLRFVENYTICQISEELNYTYRWIQTLLKNAIIEYKRINSGT